MHASAFWLNSAAMCVMIELNLTSSGQLKRAEARAKKERSNSSMMQSNLKCKYYTYTSSRTAAEVSASLGIRGAGLGFIEALHLCYSICTVAYGS